ncbi:hypothetical protein R6Q57_013942 [Mikania cordata]
MCRMTVSSDYHRDDHELLRKSFSLNNFGYSTSSIIFENEKSRTLLNEFENQSNVVWCDQMCFSEIMKEASDITCCFSSRVRHLVHLHCTTGIQRCLLHLFQCFKNDEQKLAQEGRI